MVVKGRAGKTKKPPVKDDRGGGQENKDDVERVTPKAGTKNTAKASAGKSNRRKSVRKR